MISVSLEILDQMVNAERLMLFSGEEATDEEAKLLLEEAKKVFSL